MKNVIISIFLCHILSVADAQTLTKIGEGEPILMINGGPGWSSAHLRPVAEKLSGMGYQAVLYDQRGTGSSLIEPDSSTISLSLMIEDIENIRKELGESRIVIYGHSFGGMLAMAYAVEYPDRIKKLILSAPGGCDLSFMDYYQTNLNYSLSKEELAAIAEWSSKVPEEPETASYHLVKNTISAFLFNKTLVDSIMPVITDQTWNIQTANFVWQDLFASGYDLKPKLHLVKAPTLILQGRQDALGQVNPMIISQFIPNSNLEFIEESAHLMWLDQPEKYFSKISRFLKEEKQYVNKDPDYFFERMIGSKNIDSKIFSPNGFMDIDGKASFNRAYNGIVESFTLNLPNGEVSGKAYIRYSKNYDRMELVQVDNIAGSTIILNGYWDNINEKLVFEPIKGYSQWGSTGSLSLRWEYNFNTDSTFRKSIYMPIDGEWKLQSYYDYSR